MFKCDRSENLNVYLNLKLCSRLHKRKGDIAGIVQNEMQEYKHPRRNSPNDVSTVGTYGQFSCGVPPEIHDTACGGNDIVVGVEESAMVPMRHDAKQQIKTFSPMKKLSSGNSRRNEIIINCEANRRVVEQGTQQGFLWKLRNNLPEPSNCWEELFRGSDEIELTNDFPGNGDVFGVNENEEE